MGVWLGLHLDRGLRRKLLLLEIKYPGIAVPANRGIDAGGGDQPQKCPARCGNLIGGEQRAGALGHDLAGIKILRPIEHQPKDSSAAEDGFLYRIL